VSLVITQVSAIANKLYRGSQQQKRQVQELQGLLARAQSEADDSGAISLSTVGTIASLAVPLIGGVIDHFENSGQQNQARTVQASGADDGSEALSFQDAKDIGSIAFHLGDAVKNLLGSE
jgi:hypothetical protein